MYIQYEGFQEATIFYWMRKKSWLIKGINETGEENHYDKSFSLLENLQMGNRSAFMWDHIEMTKREIGFPVFEEKNENNSNSSYIKSRRGI